MQEAPGDEYSEAPTESYCKLLLLNTPMATSYGV